MSKKMVKIVIVDCNGVEVRPSQVKKILDNANFPEEMEFDVEMLDVKPYIPSPQEVIYRCSHFKELFKPINDLLEYEYITGEMYNEAQEKIIENFRNFLREDGNIKILVRCLQQRYCGGEIRRLAERLKDVDDIDVVLFVFPFPPIIMGELGGECFTKVERDLIVTDLDLNAVIHELYTYFYYKFGGNEGGEHCAKKECAMYPMRSLESYSVKVCDVCREKLAKLIREKPWVSGGEDEVGRGG